MFRAYIRAIFYFGIAAVMAAPAMAQGRAGFGGPQADGRGGGLCLPASTPLRALDDVETAGLMHMREEEKLARDFYREMHSLWGDRIFQRISASEQQHMDAVAVLLARYGLQDPVAGTEAGEFVNGELQGMYHDLLDTGKRSLADALRAGALIEDLDLYDLKEALARTDNEDIRIVLNNLLRGSENHMRAFAGRLKALGEDYAPRYISGDEFSAIVSGGSVSAGRGKGGRQGGPENGRRLRNGNPPTQ